MKTDSKPKKVRAPRAASPEGPRNIIGPRVRALREKLGFFQEQLAQKLNERGLVMNRVQFVRLEKQQRYVSDQELVALSEILKVSPMELLRPEQTVPGVEKSDAPVG